jgi:hypothetical protein
MDKSKEKFVEEKFKDKYDTNRGEHNLDVEIINDDIFRFSMQVLAYKLLRKFHKDQVPIGVIATVVKCVAGVQMNWVKFLVNQLLMDSKEAQDKGTKFHYTCLLILISLVSWRELKDTQFLGVAKKPCLATRYVNLWHTTHKER